MLLPVVLYYVIFHYVGIYYSVIAFQDYKPMKGIAGSRFVGLKYFQEFLTSIYAWRLIRNTLLINVYQILFAFTASIHSTIASYCCSGERLLSQLGYCAPQMRQWNLKGKL